MKKIKIFLVIDCLLLLSGCASKPKLTGTGKMCGVIIDERNVPVSDYVISCRKDKGLWKNAMTNEEGLFSFDDMHFGIYTFRGSKECFLDFYDEGYVFGDRSKIFCFQLSSVDRALDLIEENIIYEEYEKALELLEQVSYKKNKDLLLVLSHYRNYINEKMEDKNVQKDEL